MSKISDWRNLWKSFGGEWHGPKVERWSIPEDQFCAFMDAALDAAEARLRDAVEAERTAWDHAVFMHCDRFTHQDIGARVDAIRAGKGVE